MSASFIYKPGTSKGPVVLVPSDGPKGSVTITTADGKTYEGRYYNTNEGRHQYIFPKDLYGQKGLKISYNGQSGEIADGNTSYEGGSIGDWQAREKGSIGADGSINGGTEGVPGKFTPGQVGKYGATPAYLGNEYPDPVFSQFDDVKIPTIKTAPYKFIDPAAFANTFGQMNREQYVKNAALSKDIALDQLDTELKGLEGYAPAAAALQRGEISKDNAFNQGQKNAQLAQELPNARGDLESQRQRANTYAGGRLPDSIQDRSLELGTRSAAADSASAGGFGTGSVAAANMSDTMSAEKRFAISQYGEGLLSKNLGDSASLLLAPLEYANAGSQIKATPTLSGSQLASNALKDINELTTMSPTNALNSAVNQLQFGSNLEQRNREYNATNKLQGREFNATGNYNESVFNAETANKFSLGKFNYDVNYASVVAGASQANINTTVAQEMQDKYQQIFKDAVAAARNSQEAKDITTAIIAAIPSIIAAVTGGKKTGGTKGGGGGTSGGGNSTDGGGDTSTDNGSDDEGSNSSPPNDVPGTHIDKDGMMVLEPGNDMPDGYHPIQTVDDGQVIVKDGSDEDRDTTPTDDGSEDEGPNSTPPKDEGTEGQDSEDEGPNSTPPKDEGTEGVDTESLSLRGYHWEPDDSGRRTLVRDKNPANDSTIKDMEADGQDTSGLKSSNLAFRSAKAQSDGLMNSIGVTTKPTPTSVQTGYNIKGQPVYSTLSLRSNNDPNAGSSQINTIKKVLAPLNVFKDQRDLDTIDRIAGISSDIGFVTQLTELYKKGDRAGFANALIGKFGKSTLGALGASKDTQDKAGMLFSAYQLFNNWDHLSAAQKGIGIANLGLAGLKTMGGQNLADVSIIKSTGTNPGMNVGQALNLFQAGYNVYDLVKNWNQLSTSAKIIKGAKTINSLAQVYKIYESFAAVSAGTAGAGVVSSGGSTAASAGSSGGSGGAAANEGGTTVGNVVGAATVAHGANQSYENFGTGGAKGARQGFMAGVEIDSGLAAMGMYNPYVYGAIIAVSTIGGMIKIGKEGGQILRDNVRKNIQRSGISDENHAITLADGTKVDIGADGHSAPHAAVDPSKMKGLTTEKNGQLHSYEVDFTNDLDYTAGMGGQTISRLVNGGKNKSIDQMGGQIGNGTISQIGFGKEFSEKNFNTLVTNQRAIYAQAGIKNKNDGYAAVEELFKAGRIDATDKVSMQQSLNMTFDRDGYRTAQKLMHGRWTGIDVAKDGSPTGDIPNPVKIPGNDTKAPSTTSGKTVSLKPGTPTPPSNVKPRMLLTKEQIVAQNKSKFGFLGSGARA